MLRRLLLLFATLTCAAAAQAQPQAQHIRPELVAEGPATPGAEVELAILMHTSPGWHGYWQNPGDAGLPMDVQWQLPDGAALGQLRYPVPSRLQVAGLMNYVYERDYAVLSRLKVPRGATGTLPIRAQGHWLACTDRICVPEQGDFALDLRIGEERQTDPRFDGWRRALPRPLATQGSFQLSDGKLRVAIPLPASVEVAEPYVFPATDNLIDYEAPQIFRRVGDRVVAELSAKGSSAQGFAGVLALSDGTGFAFEAVPGAVPAGGTPLGELGAKAILLAVLGAIAGGALLNLMPCVFPILALKALHLSHAGGDEREARSDALAYSLGAIIGTGLLGAALLLIRAAGAQAGWAFQLQDPRTIMLLLLLAVAITANLLGLFELPVLAGGARPAGGFATGALAAFVATPCAGPFLGAALGTALLLPAAGAVLVFAALGLGLALPFLFVTFVPKLRRKLPKPGPWMRRLQHFLAIPMAATAIACLWLLLRQTGRDGLIIGASAAVGLAVLLALFGRVQRRSGHGWLIVLLAAAVTGAAIWQAPVPSRAHAVRSTSGDRWSPEKVDAYLRQGHPVFVYFTADWCLTCKVNEAGAIDREAVQAAFKRAGVKVLAGDWTDGDPAITRFLESRGRAGVPLYLWYRPGQSPEELPQILTPAMLISRAQPSRR